MIVIFNSNGELSGGQLFFLSPRDSPIHNFREFTVHFHVHQCRRSRSNRQSVPRNSTPPPATFSFDGCILTTEFSIFSSSLTPSLSRQYSSLFFSKKQNFKENSSSVAEAIFPINEYSSLAGRQCSVPIMIDVTHVHA